MNLAMPHWTALMNGAVQWILQVLLFIKTSQHQIGRLKSDRMQNVKFTA